MGERDEALNLVIQGEEVETPDLKALAKIARGEAIERVSENAFRITNADAASHEAVAAHRGRGHLGHFLPAPGEVGDLVDAFDRDERRVHVEREEREVG